MSQSSKTMTERDASQVQRFAFNDVNKTLSVDGFVVGKIGHKITRSIVTTNVANDSEQFSFYDSGTLLYTILVVYTDNSLSDLVSVERTA